MAKKTFEEQEQELYNDAVDTIHELSKFPSSSYD